jgi:putative intracellular protease/amidase
MRVLILLPDAGFDVTEVAVPWFLLRKRGHEVIFATKSGDMAQPDPHSAARVFPIPFLSRDAPPPVIGDMFSGECAAFRSR